jgi:hypothetical protein
MHNLKGNYRGVKVSRLIKILNIFFVDDVLIMTSAFVQEWKVIDSILSSFCHASGLIINPHKSTLHISGVPQEELFQYKDIFPFKVVDLSVGFRYLSFYLKPTSYKIEDWRWLIMKFEKRIGSLVSRWLSLGG